jgi:hypothetical protein
VFGVTAASRNTRFQAARYGITWTGLAPADRASFGWRLPSSDHLVGDSKQAGGNPDARQLCSFQVDCELEAGWPPTAMQQTAAAGLRKSATASHMSLKRSPQLF